MATLGRATYDLCRCSGLSRLGTFSSCLQDSKPVRSGRNLTRIDLVLLRAIQVRHIHAFSCLCSPPSLGIQKNKSVAFVMIQIRASATAHP